MKYTAKIIAEVLEGEVIGNAEAEVTTIAKIEEAHEGALSFLANPKYESWLYSTQASIVLINQEFIPSESVKPTLIVVKDSYEAFAKLVNFYQETRRQELVGIDPQCTIHETAKCGENIYVGAYSYISANAQIGENVKIYPQVFIGDNVVVGDNTVIYPGVKIYADCHIGNDCILHSGVIVGSDGFGFAPQEDGSFLKIQQIGNVVIEDDVEIGANTVIDRATLGSTIIRSGVKLDNLIQIAHNVEIDKNTVMASQSGVAGSTKIGKNCMIGGQVGFVGHKKVADKTNVGAQSGVSKSITKEGQNIFGSPAYELIKFHRSYSIFKSLPDIRNQIIEMQKEIEHLKNKK